MKKFFQKIWPLFKQNRQFILAAVLTTAFTIVATFFVMGYYTQANRLKKAASDSPYLYTASDPSYSFTANIGDKITNQPVVRADFGSSSVEFTTRSLPPTLRKPSRLGNKVTFKNVDAGTDLSYQTLPNGVKENIILNKPHTGNRFSFTLKTQGTTPRQLTAEAFGTTFYDQADNYLFSLAKPFAIDRAGARTDTAYYLIQATKDPSIFEVDLFVDQDWLSDPARHYPIRIDPTIVYNTSSLFGAGQFNRVKDTGSGASPNLTTYYQELPADQHTVGLWHFDETTNDSCSGGQDACDSSSLGHHGVATGTSIDTSTPRIGTGARSFNGTSSDYISVTSTSSLSLINNYTIEAWLYRTADSGTFERILSKTDATAFDYWYQINSDDTFQCGLIKNDGNAYSANSSQTIPVGLWTHVACTFSATAGMNIYLNGSLDVGSYSGTPGTARATTRNLEIGRLGTGGTYYYSFNGVIDDLRISNVVRSAEEIKLDASRRPYSVYTSDLLSTAATAWNPFTWTELGVRTGSGETPKDSTGLIAQWNFNETSGTAANNDAEGSSCGGTPANCDGTLTGFDSTAAQDADPDSSWTANNLRWGAGALKFDGIDSFVNAGNNASLQTTGDFTIETWFATSELSGLLPFVSYGTTNDWLYYFGTNSGTLLCRLYQANSANTYLQASTTSKYADGLWHHAACTVSGTTISLYVDGALAAASTATSGSRDVSSAGALTIGKFVNATSLFYKGNLDVTRLYSRALTGSEILSDYNATNLEVQTRVGDSTSPNDGSWEPWRPVTAESIISALDSDAANWSWDSTATYAPQSKSDEANLKVEGNGSLKLALGYPQTDGSTVSLWHLEETGGTGAYLKDSAGTNHLTPTGTSVINGVVGKARSFNGSSDYLDTGSTLSSLTNNFTISLWVKPNSTQVAYANVFGNHTNNFKGIGLEQNNTSANQYYFITGNGSAWSCSVTGTTVTLTANVWQYLTFTKSSSTGITYYVNGVEAGSCGDTSNVTASTGNFMIGQGYTEALRPFGGSLDEFRIDSVVRTADEIMESYRTTRDHYLTRTVAETSLATATTLPFYIAADRPGTYLQAMIGESAYADYQPDANTTGFWHLDENRTGNNFLKFVSTNSAEANSYSYYKVLDGQSIVVATGDTIEYDVYLDNALGAVGTIDVRFSDGNYLRSYSGCHGTNLSALAYQKWYHVTCTVAAGANGKTMSWIDFVNENDTATTVTAYYDNFVIKNSGGTVKAILYTTGNPSYNVLDFESTAANTQTLSVETGDRVLKDSSGNNNFAVAMGTVHTQGKLGKARSFNGSSDYLTVTDTANLGSTSMTVEAWAYPKAYVGGAPLYNRRTVANVGGSTSETTTTGNVSCYFYINSGWRVATTIGALPLNTWSHYACTYDGQTIRTYLNGVADAATAYTGTINNPTGPSVEIGRNITGHTVLWNGYLDEVRISNSARTPTEIRQAFEVGKRTHPITIDFAAKLDSGNLITSTSDNTFTVDATTYGLSSKGSGLYSGDKIIVKENYDGTEYLAQGTVTSITPSSGAVTVASWDAGSTVPAGGFSVNADVFKWQREFFDLTGSLADSRNAITQIAFRPTSEAAGHLLWLDDLRSNTSYLTDPTGSSVGSSTNKKYFQYRVIESSSDRNVSSSFTATTTDFQTLAPAAPTIGTPTAAVSSIRWNFTDNASDETGFRLIDPTGNAVATVSAANATYVDESGLTPNTQYTRKLVSYNSHGDSVYSALASKYTLAATPNAPTVNNRTSTTVDLNVDPATNPAITTYAVYKEEGNTCDGTGGSYIAANGSDNGATAVWQTDAVWGTKTVTGLTTGKSYVFCVKAKNAEDAETSWSDVGAYNPSYVPLSGNYIYTSDTSNTNTFVTRYVDGNNSNRYVLGVDNASSPSDANTAVFEVKSGILTINSADTLVVGSLKMTGGAVAIADGGQIAVGKKLWGVDADNDGYTSNAKLYYGDSPTNGKRKSLLSSVSPSDCNDGYYNTSNNCFMVASGGTVTTSGNYKIHTFTAGTGTFTVTSTGDTGQVNYLIVGGGGGAGGGQVNESFPGGGGGGRVLAGTATLSIQGYSITVGTGGVYQPADTQNGGNGNSSTALGFTATGGGGGYFRGNGGASASGYAGGVEDSGLASAGGGGNASAGENAQSFATPARGGNGGNGTASSITGTSTYYGGGGGGMHSTNGSNGLGGGQGNYGGGGQGTAGGNGVVIISYLYQ